MRPIIALVFLSSFASAQDTDSLFNRLQGMTHFGYDFFNVDGMDISFVPQRGEFTPKAIARIYRQDKIKASEITAADDKLDKPNYYVSKTEPRGEGLVGYMDYWFIKHGDSIQMVSFRALHKVDQALARQIVLLCVNGGMPASIYQPTDPDKINFAGREINRGQSCRWMGPNNLQCPYNGQMNWSSYKTLDDANFALETHFKFLDANAKGKIISDQLVDAVFEEQDVKARKMVFDLTGVTSILAGMSGGKTLTVYMVAAQVRGKSVSCVISHWNNDRLNENGLPALGAEVLTLK
ncbi:MAG TPA: hypothetical protein VFE50_14920 [Cyclobacteriaceae bacterium]|nr:hypothetical protein [Cyclobacteriaceae bacterium]